MHTSGGRDPCTRARCAQTKTQTPKGSGLCPCTVHGGWGVHNDVHRSCAHLIHVQFSWSLAQILIPSATTLGTLFM